MTAIDASLIKFHISLNTSDLDRSIAFYRVLLGAEPAKVREDYAKFELAEPPLVLSLIPGGIGGNVNHAGLRVRTADELVDIQRRLETAGIVSQREEGVECCYARQTKFWVADPDRMLWEVYIFHEYIDERGDGAVPAVAPAPLVTLSKPLSSWTHRLGAALPDRIPHDANSLTEVMLEGSFNAGHDTVNLDKLMAEALRALRPGGAIRLHGLTGDSTGNYGKLTPCARLLAQKRRRRRRHLQSRTVTIIDRTGSCNSQDQARARARGFAGFFPVRHTGAPAHVFRRRADLLPAGSGGASRRCSTSSQGGAQSRRRQEERPLADR